MRYTVAIAIAASALAACAIAGLSQQSVSAAVSRQAAVEHAVASERSEAIVTASASRLELMPEVAYTKYRLNLPIEDPVREKQAESAFVDGATARGIDAELARNVIRDQMVASKMVQYDLMSRWKVSPPPVRPYKDLAKELRPEIDQATQRLTAGLADAVAAGIPADWHQQVQRSIDIAARTLDVAVGRAPLERSLASVEAMT